MNIITQRINMYNYKFVYTLKEQIYSNLLDIVEKRGIVDIDITNNDRCKIQYTIIGENHGYKIVDWASLSAYEQKNVYVYILYILLFEFGIPLLNTSLMQTVPLKRHLYMYMKIYVDKGYLWNTDYILNLYQPLQNICNLFFDKGDHIRFLVEKRYARGDDDNLLTLRLLFDKI